MARRSIEERISQLEAQRKTLEGTIGQTGSSQGYPAQDTARCWRGTGWKIVVHEVDVSKGLGALVAPGIAGLPHARRRQGAVRRSADRTRNAGTGRARSGPGRFHWRQSGKIKCDYQRRVRLTGCERPEAVTAASFLDKHFAVVQPSMPVVRQSERGAGAA